jgi:hypothetical protein
MRDDEDGQTESSSTCEEHKRSENEHESSESENERQESSHDRNAPDDQDDDSECI